MSAKKSTKREFDWRAYTRPPRLLTPAQESTLDSGPLRALADAARAGDGLSLQIRARQAALYYRGTTIVRLTNAAEPFLAQIDANLRLPRAERTGAERLESFPVQTAAEVEALLGQIATLRALADGWAAEESSHSAREQLLAFAEANGPRAGDDAELIVVDVEYQYGKRRFDFVAMRRAAGVGGLGAFTTPRLVVGELYAGDRRPDAANGLTSFGADAAEFVRALSGEHLGRAKVELADLVEQKVRLGLLPADLPFQRFTADNPELLVVFTTPKFSATNLDAPLAEFHDRAVARHFAPDLIRLAAIGPARPEGDDSLQVSEDDILTYRAFKGLRKRLQG